MDHNKGAFRRGFTIIEVLLFLALSGLMLVGVLVGVGSSVARQRYNDAVQDVADMLRDQYSFVTDTQISLRDKTSDKSCYGLVFADLNNPDGFYNWDSSYRGRTDCVVYGAVVTINSTTMQTTELIGRDYKTMVAKLEAQGETLPENLTDIQLLYNLRANNMYFHCTNSSANSCTIRTSDRLRTKTTKWGTKLYDETGKALERTMIIFRSPRDGSIRTYVMKNLIRVNGVSNGTIVTDAGTARTGLTAANLDQRSVYQYLSNGKTDKFLRQDLKICIDSGNSQTYAGTRRMVKVQAGGSGQSSVILVDMDSEKEEDKCKK